MNNLIADQINAIYTALTATVARWRGSVISFAGDAITCWFDAVDGPAAPRAAACACALQAAMASFAAVALPDGHTAFLMIKVAIASGSARRCIVGDPALQQIDVLAGATVARMACGEHLARPGEVLLDAATVAALGPGVSLGEQRADPEHGDTFRVDWWFGHAPDGTTSSCRAHTGALGAGIYRIA
jgi:class 3 adenylate cyclase